MQDEHVREIHSIKTKLINDRIQAADATPNNNSSKHIKYSQADSFDDLDDSEVRTMNSMKDSRLSKSSAVGFFAKEKNYKKQSINGSYQ
jgi:hypothetical protein